MTDPLDVSLHDAELIDEIRLYGDLIVIASESLGPLNQAVIDRVLGVAPASAPRVEVGSTP
jgi:hypothetical protein